MLALPHWKVLGSLFPLALGTLLRTEGESLGALPAWWLRSATQPLNERVLVAASSSLYF